MSKNLLLKTTKAVLLKPTIDNHVIFAEHDMPCSICLEKPAVLDMTTGIFTPCWGCQEKGYKIIKINRSLKWWHVFIKRYKII